MRKRRLLWVGDAGVSTGFARVTHKVCDYLYATGDWDIEVLGMSYRQDPLPTPEPIRGEDGHWYHRARWPYVILGGATAPGHDPFGVRRLPEALERHRPDICVMLQDPWFIPQYLEKAGDIPTLAWLAVDGRNVRGADYLSGLSRAVFWTEFALEEARSGGYSGPAGVVPLGVDTKLYRPLPQAEARKAWNIHRSPAADAYIVGNINRNQPRKRIELTIHAFATWVLEHDVRDAFLMLHLAPTGEHAIDVKQLMGYYGLAHRLILPEPSAARMRTGQGWPEAELAGMYSVFDCMLSTTQGEGFGLTTLEGMAAGVPQIVPAWSALEEICAGAARFVPCSSISVTAGSFYLDRTLNPNIIGGVPDIGETIRALDELYRAEELRAELADKGRARASEERFQWDNIGAALHRELERALAAPNITRLDGEGHAGN